MAKKTYDQEQFKKAVRECLGILPVRVVLEGDRVVVLLKTKTGRKIKMEPVAKTGRWGFAYTVDTMIYAHEGVDEVLEDDGRNLTWIGPQLVEPLADAVAGGAVAVVVKNDRRICLSKGGRNGFSIDLRPKVNNEWDHHGGPAQVRAEVIRRLAQMFKKKNFWVAQ